MPWSAVTVSEQSSGRRAASRAQLAVDALELVTPLPGVAAVHVADLVERRPSRGAPAPAAPTRTAARVASTRCVRVRGRDEAATADGGVGEPRPVEEGRPDRARPRPRPRPTASKTVSCGCQARGSGPSSQDSSLSSRSVAGHEHLVAEQPVRPRPRRPGAEGAHRGRRGRREAARHPPGRRRGGARSQGACPARRTSRSWPRPSTSTVTARRVGRQVEPGRRAPRPAAPPHGTPEAAGDAGEHVGERGPGADRRLRGRVAGGRHPAALSPGRWRRTGRGRSRGPATARRRRRQRPRCAARCRRR